MRPLEEFVRPSGLTEDEAGVLANFEGFDVVQPLGAYPIAAALIRRLIGPTKQKNEYESRPLPSLLRGLATAMEINGGFRHNAVEVREAAKQLTVAEVLLREAPVVLPSNAYVGDWVWHRDRLLDAMRGQQT